MARRRTRFMASIGGSERQLFSIGETSDQGLNLVFSTGTTGDHLSGERLPIEVRKVSVHPSPKTNGYTIKLATQFQNGDKCESTVFIEDGKDGFFYPLVGRLEPGYSTEKERRIKSKDTIVSIGDFDEATHTLVYVAMVMDCNSHFDKNMTSARPFFRADFSKFRILMFPTLLPFPATPSGSITTFGHTPSRWNDAELNEYPDEGAPNWIPPQLLGIFLRATILTFRKKIMANLFRTFGAGDELVAGIEFFAWFDEREKELEQEADEVTRRITGILPSGDDS